MTDVLRESIDIPVCPKCRGKHFPHEVCKNTGEDHVTICSLCIGPHATTDCPVLTPDAAWQPPDLPAKSSHRRRRGGRRHRRR